MFGFPKHNRLLKSGEYQAVVQNRDQRKVVSQYLVVIASNAVDETAPSRIGIIATRKFGNAIKRNHFKRAIREEFRHLKSQWQGLDVVVIARHQAADATKQTIRASFAQSMQRLN